MGLGRRSLARLVHTIEHALVLAAIDNEPRVLDTDLAVKLGMAVPRKIRSDIIAPNHAELADLGTLRSHCLQTAGRPANAFYLNEEQALLVCMLARTEKAKQVRAEVIRVFTAWRRGELVEAPPAMPDFTNPVLAARAWAALLGMGEFAQRSAASAPKSAC